MKSIQAEDGDVFPVTRWDRHRCCDCGLVHDFHFFVRKRRVMMQVWTNRKASAAIRRSRRKQYRKQLRKTGLVR